MIAGDVAHRDGGGLGDDAALDKRKLVRRVVEQLVAARLRLQHEREGRVAGDGDFFDRVHLDGDVERHVIQPSGAWPKPATARRSSQPRAPATAQLGSKFRALHGRIRRLLRRGQSLRSASAGLRPRLARRGRPWCLGFVPRFAQQRRSLPVDGVAGVRDGDGKGAASRRRRRSSRTSRQCR